MEQQIVWVTNENIWIAMHWFKFRRSRRPEVWYLVSEYFQKNYFTNLLYRNLLEVSSQIQYVYTTTKICIPHGIDICSDAVNLWNQTYVKFDGIVKKLLFEDGEINFFEVDTQKCSRLSCYSGEPQLEKLMDNGN